MSLTRKLPRFKSQDEENRKGFRHSMGRSSVVEIYDPLTLSSPRSRRQGGGRDPTDRLWGFGVEKVSSGIPSVKRGEESRSLFTTSSTSFRSPMFKSPRSKMNPVLRGVPSQGETP